jgi:endonuclease YncB( thermonuclease family)
MGDRRSTPLRMAARPSPFRRPVLKFNPLPKRPEHTEPRLPASLPMTWKRAVGLGLLGLASFAIVALQVMAIFRVVAFLLIAPATAEPIQPDDVRVIDGDTIRFLHRQPDIRLVGFNAPETRRALCEAEADLGAKATRRLREIVRAGNLDFRFVACSCLPGTEGTEVCNFGRRCGRLASNGRDVGSILISEGLAVQFSCGTTSCPRLPRPWCQ